MLNNTLRLSNARKDALITIQRVCLTPSLKCLTFLESYLAITPEEARRRKEEERQANAKRPLFSNEGGVSVIFILM